MCFRIERKHEKKPSQVCIGNGEECKWQFPRFVVIELTGSAVKQP